MLFPNNIQSTSTAKICDEFRNTSSNKISSLKLSLERKHFAAKFKRKNKYSFTSSVSDTAVHGDGESFMLNRNDIPDHSLHYFVHKNTVLIGDTAQHPVL